jgi:fatty acid desaturase
MAMVTSPAPVTADGASTVTTPGEPAATAWGAALLTHAPLVALTAIYFAIVTQLPIVWGLVPGVIVAHRIGTLLHEYIHGIPFRRYATNHGVVTLYDGILLMFGTLELFRVDHLLHHKWLNTDDDHSLVAATTTGTSRVADALAGLAIVQYLAAYVTALRGHTPQVRRGRMLAGALLSLACIVAWTAAGHGDVVGRIFAIAIVTMLGPVSLRSAIEHHSHPSNPHFANEYRVAIPLFNLNRHIHHHEDPTLPWYHLRWRTPNPLPRWHYVAHWFHVYIKRDFSLMRPMSAAEARQHGSQHGSQHGARRANAAR